MRRDFFLRMRSVAALLPAFTLSALTKALLPFLLVVFLNDVAAAQIVMNTLANDGQEIPMQPDTVTRLSSFSGKCVKDTAYLKWLVADMYHKGVFVIYRSEDGMNFGIVATKNISAAPVKRETAHYFRDVSFGGGIKYYRLAYINARSEYLVSEKAKVICESGDLAETKKQERKK